MRTTIIVALVVVLAFASPATALARSAQSVSAEVASVHRAISWQKSRTWHWQDVARVKRSPTIRGAAGPHSTGYLHWIEHRWNRRRVHAYRLAHRPRSTYRTLASTGGIAHEALWLCIHNGEAGWHQPSYAVDSHGVPLYWGGLQMHAGWGYGTSYHASDDSPYVQMRAAETGYRASGYSLTWLNGQWGADSSCFGLA